MERCRGVGRSAMARVSGKGRLQPADSGLGGSLLLAVGGHRLGVEVVAVFVEGVRSLRAHETVDGPQTQHLPRVLRQLDGFELAVIALDTHLHDFVSCSVRTTWWWERACMIPRGSTCANSQVLTSYEGPCGSCSTPPLLWMLLPGKSYRRPAPRPRLEYVILSPTS